MSRQPRDEYQVEEQPSVLALLEKSVELRTVPPVGLRPETLAPCSMAGCENGVLTLNRMSLPCPRCRKREAGK